ncbi:MAG: hypothetical protein IJV82_03355 [Oscillospiraceae bacterium]|nr:hypothetical protein [Oscillospiraceae bacterium]
MKEQLTKYVELLFAGTTGTEEIQQEILQNTLDKYDDLISQGKTPEAAYRLAISGIGDINEIIGDNASPAPASAPTLSEKINAIPIGRNLFKGIAILLYIICPIPLFILSELGLDTIGLCGTLAVAGVATLFMFLGGKIGAPTRKAEQTPEPKNELNKAIDSLLGIVSLIIFLGLSFATGGWWITWLVFPIQGAIKGLIKACIDLKEAVKHES